MPGAGATARLPMRIIKIMLNMVRCRQSLSPFVAEACSRWIGRPQLSPSRDTLAGGPYQGLVLIGGTHSEARCGKRCRASEEMASFEGLFEVSMQQRWLASKLVALSAGRYRNLARLVCAANAQEPVFSAGVCVHQTRSWLSFARMRQPGQLRPMGAPGN